MPPHVTPHHTTTLNHTTPPHLTTSHHATHPTHPALPHHTTPPHGCSVEPNVHFFSYQLNTLNKENLRQRHLLDREAAARKVMICLFLVYCCQYLCWPFTILCCLSRSRSGRLLQLEHSRACVPVRLKITCFTRNRLVLLGHKQAIETAAVRACADFGKVLFVFINLIILLRVCKPTWSPVTRQSWHSKLNWRPTSTQKSHTGIQTTLL